MNGIKHFLLIPDGDRRYAKRTGSTLEEAYARAADVLLELIEWIHVDHDIPEFSFFGLSYANVMHRSREDILPIFKQQIRFLNDVPSIQLFKDYGIRLRVHGFKELLPVDYQAAIFRAEDATSGFFNKTCNLLLAYSGKKDLEQAFRKVDAEGKAPNLGNIERHLFIKTPIDLIVRTADEKRLSDSPLIPAAYSEFHAIESFFPELKKKEIDEAIEEYLRRVRTYGE